jgi:hypothetical protein
MKGKEGRKEGRERKRKEGKGEHLVACQSGTVTVALYFVIPREPLPTTRDWIVPLQHFVFSIVACTSLHFRPWASLFSAASNLVARHLALSPFLCFPFGARADGDDANDFFVTKCLDVVEVRPSPPPAVTCNDSMATHTPGPRLPVGTSLVSAPISCYIRPHTNAPACTCIAALSCKDK